nr:MAG TPA: hypothetical protein [Caudoviricetes sp.]
MLFSLNFKGFASSTIFLRKICKRTGQQTKNML